MAVLLLRVIYDFATSRLQLMAVSLFTLRRDFPGGSDIKASAYNVGDLSLIPGSGRSSGEGNGNPLQYSCLENPMDGGAWGSWSTWRATVRGVAKSRTWLSDFTLPCLRDSIGNTILSPNPSSFLKSELCFLNLFFSIKENTSEV